MIERKTYEADIERLRPRLFILSLIVVVGVFFLVLNFKSLNITSKILEALDDDVEIDMELMPNIEKDDGFVPAPDEKKKSADQINKIDDKQDMRAELQELKKSIEFKPGETDDETLQPADVEPMPEPVLDDAGKEIPPGTLEGLPEFPGGMSEFAKWLTLALKYPSRSLQKKEQGTVIMSFVVEKDGTVTNITFKQQTHTALDAEVLRVMRIMPKWKPASDKGKPCRSMVTVPVVFAM